VYLNGRCYNKSVEFVGWRVELTANDKDKIAELLSASKTPHSTLHTPNLSWEKI